LAADYPISIIFTLGFLKIQIQVFTLGHLNITI